MVDLGPAVAEALSDGRGVVALESSLVAQGLPPPHNLDAARGSEDAVRAAGSVPATVAIDAGRILVGADDQVLERLAAPGERPAKAASRDLGPLLASRRLAATTVSATVRAAFLAGIRVHATGGIGGVHRDASTSFDVSSDIDELAATPVAVVCSGAKSILDLRATLELLETRRVPVVGIATDELPAFYSASSGMPVPHSVATVAEAADVAEAHFGVAGGGGILFVQPPPADLALDRVELDELVAEAAAASARDGVSGGAVTPAVLAHVARLSGGRTLATNIGLIVNNARMAGHLAAELALRTAGTDVGYHRPSSGTAGSPGEARRQ